MNLDDFLKRGEYYVSCNTICVKYVKLRSRGDFLKGKKATQVKIDDKDLEKIDSDLKVMQRMMWDLVPVKDSLRRILEDIKKGNRYEIYKDRDFMLLNEVVDCVYLYTKFNMIGEGFDVKMIKFLNDYVDIFFNVNLRMVLCMYGKENIMDACEMSFEGLDGNIYIIDRGDV